MKTLTLTLLLIPAIAFAELRERRDVFAECESELAKKEGWAITTRKQADDALFRALREYSPNGISAYWGWGIRDVIVLPGDAGSIGQMGDVILIGHLQDLLKAPLPVSPAALFLINARSGEVTTISAAKK